LIVIDGEVVEKYDKDTDITEGTNIIEDKRPIAGNSKIDNRIIGSNIVKDIVKDESVRNKRDEADNNLITVSGKELEEYRDFKELSMTAKKYYVKAIQGTSITRDDIGRVEFTMRGIKKTINEAKGYIDILKVIPIIKEIVKNGENLGKAKANKEREDGGVFISIEKNIKLDDIIRKVTILIIKYPDNKMRYYLMYLDLNMGNK
jgi:hypothetical protein